MWCAESAAAASKRSARVRSGRLAPLVARIEEPLPEKLELEVGQAVVVEELPYLGERSRLEDMLEVGVPEPGPFHADACCLRAAVTQVEQAPLAADVHLDRAGDRPVEPEQFVAASHPLPAT